jgi:hypothetical protein
MSEERIPSVLEVANEILRIAWAQGRTVSNMKLQKLVYIAHGWSLAILGKPLFYEPIYAWTYGPVVPRLYNALIKYGAGEVTELIPIPGRPKPKTTRLPWRQRVGSSLFSIGLRLFPSWRDQHEIDGYQEKFEKKDFLQTTYFT